MMNRLSILLSSVVVLVGVGVGCGVAAAAKVHEVTGQAPPYERVDVTDAGRFLNDLMLSPLWKVEKLRGGGWIARARSIGPEVGFGDAAGRFLFEFMADGERKLPQDYRIRNDYTKGDIRTFSTMAVCVIFHAPGPKAARAGPGKSVSIGIYEPFEEAIGPNSTSELAIRLSTQHEIYVVIHEQGRDKTRRTTLERIPAVMRELSGVAASPARYRVEERYEALLKLLFDGPLQDQGLKRQPGMQGRDTFYGYFRVQPERSYSGINIRISHPVYCPGEGTRKSSRLAKAEYPGVPYMEQDVVFFLIEDNAVYLTGEADQRFGIFSGTESFDGVLEVLNDQEKVLLRTVDKFRGWQR